MALPFTRDAAAAVAFGAALLTALSARTQTVAPPDDEGLVAIVTVRVLTSADRPPLYRIEQLHVLAGDLPAHALTVDRSAAGQFAPRAVDPSDALLPEIAVLDAAGRTLFRQRFSYAAAMTVPPPRPGEPNDDGPAVIPADDPEVVLVVPYFATAAKVEVYEPGTGRTAASRAIAAADLETGGRQPVRAEPRAAAVPGALNVLIVASGYLPAEMNRFEDRAIEVRDAILGTPPFLAERERVHITPYENTADLGCHGGCGNVARALCCTSAAVLSAAARSRLPYDEIIVIHNSSTYSGTGAVDDGSYKYNSYSTYAVDYDGPDSALVAVHEFGHSFGSLCDEYLIGVGTYPYKCVNCRSKCDELELASLCQNSCAARLDYFRPDASVMYSLSSRRYNLTSVLSTYAPDGLQMRLDYFTGGSAAREAKGVFPPRDQVLSFRETLEQFYRDTLRRSPELTSVDIEGQAVWLPEYLRYRLSGCDHSPAVQRVLAQIGGYGVQPGCGPIRSSDAFPPRDQTLRFRVELERVYRDDLHSAGTLTAVDIEGNAVWLQEYLRYRLSGCSHAQASSKVMLQIDRQGIQPVCY